MAEGGCAASMGNANSNDNWQVHFRDTMRGGKFLNNWRMAELHAKEAPDRVWELETYGALFDRTKDGQISQRNFGGHEYPRLAHVGDRTGLELIRTMQQKIVSLQQDDARKKGSAPAPTSRACRCSPSSPSPTCSRPTTARSPARSATGARPASSSLFKAPAVVLATGGIGKSFKVTSNSWECTGDGMAPGAARRLDADEHGVRPVPPDRHGLAAVGEGHPRHRGRARRRRRAEELRGQAVHVRLRAGRVPRAVRRTTRTRPTRWYKDPDHNKRTPDLLPRDEVARAINSEVKAGRGSPHGGVFLDIASRLPKEEILRRLPSMHHQFKELADVDITDEPMEVGPDLPLRDGRRRGRRRHRGGGTRARACSPPARSPAACTARTGSAATRCPTCWCSAGAPARARPRTSRRSAGKYPTITDEQIDGVRADGARAVRAARTARTPTTLHARAAAGDERPGRHHPQGERDRRRRSSGSRSSRSGRST